MDSHQSTLSSAAVRCGRPGDIMSDESAPLVNFSGTARLFPLPNLVLFPQVIQPLHIFEPRYRQMAADALDEDRFIALALLRPGWEPDYGGTPPIFSTACLGKIVADQCLPDGRFNLLLRGVSRVRIVHEIPHSKLYRLAKVELIDEIPVAEEGAERKLRRVLTRRVPSWFSGQSAILDQFRKLLKSDLALGALCDILAFALPLEATFKQELLEEADVEKRVRHMLHFLKSHDPPTPAPAGDRKFPPEFSDN
jgi:Lon protease-like protein